MVLSRMVSWVCSATLRGLKDFELEAKLLGCNRLSRKGQQLIPKRRGIMYERWFLPGSRYGRHAQA